MSTIRQTIQAEIDTITQEASTKIAALRAKMEADEPTLIALLDTEVEKVEHWFGKFAAHFRSATPSA